jgi:hypothetical protein
MKRVVLPTVSLVLVALLVACGGPAPTPTARPKSPTETPLIPEEPALSVEQVAGKWAMHLMGGGGGDLAVFTLSADGTYSMDGVGGYHAGMNVGYGTFRFEGDALLLESELCLRVSEGRDVFFPCTASYHVFASMAEGKTESLRFVALDDPFGDRKQSLDNKTFAPYGD